jgi:hypothetical protein
MKTFICNSKLMLFCVMVAALVALLPACRKKVTGGDGQDTTQQDGPWRLFTYTDGLLRAGAFDTINVRLYNEFGTLLNGQSVSSICLVDPPKVVTPVVTSSDTVHNPWGTTAISPLRYWGDGGANGTETIFSWVMHAGDTMATATTSFLVQRP